MISLISLLKLSSMHTEKKTNMVNQFQQKVDDDDDDDDDDEDEDADEVDGE